MMFFGVFCLPFGPPKPGPITAYIGKPIIVPKILEPTDEEIDKYHLEFIAGTEKLYHDNKAAHGYADIPLCII